MTLRLNHMRREKNTWVVILRCTIGVLCEKNACLAVMVIVMEHSLKYVV